jgi:hypothetical protein
MMGKFKRGQPNGNSYSQLKPEQKGFIQARVKELGSMKKVVAYYKRQALVDRFALSEAKKIY